MCGTKIFLPILQKQKSAHIVNISSLYGFIAPPGNAAYSASKFAVRGFTEALRHELEDTHIAVSVVHPGGIKTNIANSAKIGSGVNLTKKEIKQRTKDFNEKLARTSPEQAAEIIVNGIKKRETRIVIGIDAKILSFLARVFPRRYFSVLNKLTGGKLKS